MRGPNEDTKMFEGEWFESMKVKVKKHKRSLNQIYEQLEGNPLSPGVHYVVEPSQAPKGYEVKRGVHGSNYYYVGEPTQSIQQTPINVVKGKRVKAHERNIKAKAKVIRLETLVDKGGDDVFESEEEEMMTKAQFDKYVKDLRKDSDIEDLSFDWDEGYIQWKQFG